MMILMVWLASNPLISSKSWVKFVSFLYKFTDSWNASYTARCSMAVVSLEALREYYIDLGKPKSGARIFFPARLFNKTKAPTMDKVRGNINGFSFATSPYPCRGLIIIQCPWYSWLCMIKVAPCTVGRTVVRLYGCTSNFFRLDGLLLFCNNYGATLCELR